MAIAFGSVGAAVLVAVASVLGSNAQITQQDEEHN
jgi:hypothetical protein